MLSLFSQKAGGVHGGKYVNAQWPLEYMEYSHQKFYTVHIEAGGGFSFMIATEKISACATLGKAEHIHSSFWSVMFYVDRHTLLVSNEALWDTP